MKRKNQKLREKEKCHFKRLVSTIVKNLKGKWKDNPDENQTGDWNIAAKATYEGQWAYDSMLRFSDREKQSPGPSQMPLPPKQGACHSAALWIWRLDPRKRRNGGKNHCRKWSIGAVPRPCDSTLRPALSETHWSFSQMFTLVKSPTQKQLRAHQPMMETWHVPATGRCLAASYRLATYAQTFKPWKQNSEKPRYIPRPDKSRIERPRTHCSWVRVCWRDGKCSGRGSGDCCMAEYSKITGL